MYRFSKSSEIDKLLKLSLHPKLYNASVSASKEIHSRGISCTLKQLEILSPFISSVTTSIVTKNSLSQDDDEDEKEQDISESKPIIDSNLQRKMSNDSKLDAVVDDYKVSDDKTVLADEDVKHNIKTQESTHSSSSSSSNQKEQQDDIDLGPVYPEGAVVAQVDALFEIEETYLTKAAGGEEVETTRTITSRAYCVYLL